MVLTLKVGRVVMIPSQNKDLDISLLTPLVEERIIPLHLFRRQVNETGVTYLNYGVTFLDGTFFEGVCDNRKSPLFVVSVSYCKYFWHITKIKGPGLPRGLNVNVVSSRGLIVQQPTAPRKPFC